ncbi:redoxin [Sphingobacterium sp. HJSM2_6]|uniref:redoxin n=1 Tax=Sphingobacterium sp. HJSM2_6 TaxID=3366264 RepID=UPI003BC50EE1
MKIYWIVSLFLFLSSHDLLGQAPKQLPAFQQFINYTNQAPFTIDSLDKKHKQVFILYDPGCGHCQELGNGMGKMIHQLDTAIDYYLISMVEKEQVDGFINMFAKPLKNHPQVTFLYDPVGEFITLFHPKNFPSTYIYDKGSLKLIKHFDGENKFEKLFPILKINK